MTLASHLAVVNIHLVSSASNMLYCYWMLRNLHNKFRIFPDTWTDQREVQASLQFHNPNSLHFLLTNLLFVSTNMLYADRTVKIPFRSKFRAEKSSTQHMHNGILRIALVSAATKSWSRTTLLHVALVLSMSALTIAGGLAERHAIDRIVAFLGMQFSFQIYVVEPSPMRLIRPWQKTSRSSIMARQTWEGRLPNSASRLLPYRK